MSESRTGDAWDITYKLWSLLSAQQRRRIVILIGLSLVGTALEIVGIGLVVPAIGLMTQEDIGEQYPAIEPILSLLGSPSQERLIVWGMCVLVVTYLVKALFLAFLNWRQQKFVNEVQSDLSQRMFTGYLRQPYVFHLQRNSAQLIRNAVIETDLFAGTVLVAGLSFATELFVLIGVSMMLIYIEPIGTLSILIVFGLLSYGFMRLTRRHIARWGVLRQDHEGARLQHLQQGLGGAKDVKLLGREADFLSEFRKHNQGRARVVERQGTLNQLPRLWLEFVAVAALAGLLFVMMYLGKPASSVLPVLGLFSIGAFRLLPSINRLLGASQNLRYGLPAVTALHQESKFLVDAPLSLKKLIPLPLSSEIILDNVHYRYPAGHEDVLRGVSMKIRCGSTVGIIGSTGSGKSTLIDIILGLLEPSAGEVRADGTNIIENVRGWQNNLGYVPQSIFLTDDTIRRNVAFGLPAKQIDESSVWRALSAAQLDVFALGLRDRLDTLVGERGTRLSGGQRQRVGIARALYHDPCVLVLDEATSALDMATEREVMNTIRSFHNKKTIIIVAHRLSTVEHCDYVYRLERGQIIAEGKPASILAKTGGH